MDEITRDNLETLLIEALNEGRLARQETRETLTGFRLEFICGRLEMLLEALEGKEAEETK